MARSLQNTRNLISSVGNDPVLVALSGGKDSLVTLDLIVSVLGAGRVEAFYMYYPVRDLRCVESGVDAAASRYGIPLLKVPHWALSHRYRAASLMNDKPLLQEKLARRPTKMVDVENYVREKTGIQWIAYGHRMAESIQRRGMLNQCQGVWRRFHRLYPVYDWLAEDIFAYMRTRRIPLPPPFGFSNDGRSSGPRLMPDTLHWIKQHYPDDFARICAVFPFAEAAALRYELFGDPTKPKEKRRA